MANRDILSTALILKQDKDKVKATKVNTKAKLKTLKGRATQRKGPFKTNPNANATAVFEQALRVAPLHQETHVFFPQASQVNLMAKSELLMHFIDSLNTLLWTSIVTRHYCLSQLTLA